MIFTDPPFGHKNNDGDLIGNREKALGKGPEGPARPIKNDGKIAHGLFLWSLYQYERLLVSAGCCCCCCGGGGPDPMFGKWALWMDDVMRFKQMIVWDKGKMGMGWHYRRSYETVLVAEKRGTGKARWFDESHRVENIIRPGDYGIKKIIPNKDQHPTQKPIALSSHFIGLHSQPGETILDPYMGRGSTGIAALRSGRKFIGIEIDPEHFHKAKELIEKEAAQ
jgi:site-specific DNA-methyltransferase (adenine-specific)